MKFKELFIKIVDFLGTVSFSVIIVVCMAQVINRYFLGGSFAWADELAVELMIWIGFLGAAKGVAQQSHTNLAVLVNAMPPKVQCFMRVLSNLLCMAFAGLCLYYGTTLSINSWSSITTGTKIPLGLVYAAVPIGCLFMVLFLIVNIIDEIREYKKLCRGKNEGGGEIC